jgi:putative intracellular protease/amidase
MSSIGASVVDGDTHRMQIDTITSRKREVLLVVANPTMSDNNGWPVGFWAAEITHPYYELTEAGFMVTIASPLGGRAELDALSDPRDASGWSSDDLISMGFLNTPALAARLDETPSLDSLDLGRYEAILVAGGQAPMFTFRDNPPLQRAIRTFYETERLVAVYCHGVAALVDLQLSDDTYLVNGRTVTGFSNVEEDYGDAATGVQINPWRLEDALRERGANYVSAGLFKPFAVRDGRLITGQQQYSGRTVARMVIAALGV